MMNNMKMMNDMELNMVAGGDISAHGSGASGSWDDHYGVKPHGGGVSGGWDSPVQVTEPVPEVAAPQTQVTYETEITIIMYEEMWKPHGRINWDCPW